MTIRIFTIVALAMSAFSTSALSETLVCSDKKKTELIAIETHGATFKQVVDQKNGSRYAAFTEQVASDRMDYQTADFTLALQTLGLQVTSCPRGKYAFILRKGAKKPVDLCCK